MLVLWMSCVRYDRIFQNFTGMSLEFHRMFNSISPEFHQMFARISNCGTLTKGIGTIQPSRTLERGPFEYRRRATPPHRS